MCHESSLLILHHTECVTRKGGQQEALNPIRKYDSNFRHESMHGLSQFWLIQLQTLLTANCIENHAHADPAQLGPTHPRQTKRTQPTCTQAPIQFWLPPTLLRSPALSTSGPCMLVSSFTWGACVTNTILRVRHSHMRSRIFQAVVLHAGHSSFT